MENIQKFADLLEKLAKKYNMEDADVQALAKAGGAAIADADVNNHIGSAAQPETVAPVIPEDELSGALER